MNHRMGQRIATDHPISLFIAEHGWIEGELINISLTGAAVRCDEWRALETCMPVEVLLEPADGRRPEQVKIHGFVVRRQRGLIGLMFMRDVVELVQRLRHESASGNMRGLERPLASTG